MTTTLTVLGSAGTHPGAGRACSSYLVSTGGTRLLLDCGNGSLANLQQVCDVADVAALVVSHLHPDHFADLYGLYYALRFHPRGQRWLPVYAPAGAQEFVARLLGADSRDSFAEVCRWQVVAAGDAVEVGPMTVRLFAARHPIETLASRVEVGDAVVAYSADSAPARGVVDCARDADLFVCDATWLERQRPLPAGVHMTGAEAGRSAAEAGARRLLVSHVIPSNDPAAVADEAATEFGAPVVAAEDLQEHAL